MILLAIEVVLLFIFTSSDNFTRLFYNLSSFVSTYDPVYKTDTPESILNYGKSMPSLAWTITPNNREGAAMITAQKGVYLGWGPGSHALGALRPVLYLNNI